MKSKRLEDVKKMEDPEKRGDGYFTLRKYEEAIDSYLEALSQDTGKVSVNIKLGESYMKLGKYLEAKQTFEEISRIKPDNVVVRNQLHRISVSEIVEQGDHFKRINDFPKALEMYYNAFKIDSKCVSALFKASEIYLEEGKIETALNLFNKLIEMDSLYQEEYKHVLNHLAISLGHHKLHDKAVALYKKAISLDPEDEALYFNLAMVFIRLKKFEAAKVLLNKALEIDNEFKEARQLLTKIS